MAAAKAINSGDSIVSLPRTAALLVTPKMKCPFPELIDSTYWAKSQWYAHTLLFVLPTLNQISSLSFAAVAVWPTSMIVS